MAMSFLQTPEEMGIMDFDPESGKPARVKKGALRFVYLFRTPIRISQEAVARARR